MMGKVSDGVLRVGDDFDRRHGHYEGYYQENGLSCQIVRSCAKWSHGGALEVSILLLLSQVTIPLKSRQHSIANAYISVIQNSQHFIYIENQFFITATDDKQKPIKNKIGAAIVERIARAARTGQRFKVFVIMPAVPGFAGDLQDDASLGTRAIMEFQYNSINRGGYSIMESLAKLDIDPTEYIRFYNLRNYDRINSSAAMNEAEQRSGVNYEDARRQHDDMVGAGFGGYGEGTVANEYSAPPAQYQQYQNAAQDIKRRQGLGDGAWDSVSKCYMLGGPDIRSAPWENGNIPEIDAFVSEELYVHSKVRLASNSHD
jgi:phospholipase D1/2